MSKTINHNGWEIEAYSDLDSVYVDISVTKNGTFYSGSLACAENEGQLECENWEKTIKVPQTIIKKAIALEDELQEANK
jgi:hypothetical protein